jgi:hypothetical protein
MTVKAGRAVEKNARESRPAAPTGLAAKRPQASTLPRQRRPRVLPSVGDAIVPPRRRSGVAGASSDEGSRKWTSAPRSATRPLSLCSRCCWQDRRKNRNENQGAKGRSFERSRGIQPGTSSFLPKRQGRMRSPTATRRVGGLRRLPRRFFPTRFSRRALAPPARTPADEGAARRGDRHVMSRRPRAPSRGTAARSMRFRALLFAVDNVSTELIEIDHAVVLASGTRSYVMVAHLATAKSVAGTVTNTMEQPNGFAFRRGLRVSRSVRASPAFRH